MYAVSRAMAESLASRLADKVRNFSSESQALGLGRTILALAQASVFAFTPADRLFVPVGATEPGANCGEATGTVSLFCLLPSGYQVDSYIVVILLLIVASGILPRFTAILHYWVSLSVGTSISLPDGGESVAMTATLFLMFALANDRRVWHWQTPNRRTGARTSVLQGSAFAGMWALRLQMAYIYLNSALAKLPVEQWSGGSATYYVSRMENFGAAGILAEVFRFLLAVPLIALATAWGTIVIEALIGVFLIVGGKRSVVALVLSVCLHIGIIAMIGIVSFGWVMIGAMICATSQGIEEVRLRARRPPVGTAEHEIVVVPRS